MKFNCLFAAQILGLALALDPLSFGQSMNFSVYTDVTASDDFSTLYNDVSVSDNSSCSHSGYSTTAIIDSPDGGSSSTAGGGLSSTTSLAINFVTGNYSVAASVTYYCACIRTSAGAGGGEIIGVGVSATNYVFNNQSGNTCTYTPQDCDATPTCGAAQGRISATGSAPCYQYYLQQMGSIIYQDGTRRCTPLQYIPPNYFSGGQNVRAACT